MFVAPDEAVDLLGFHVYVHYRTVTPYEARYVACRHLIHQVIPRRPEGIPMHPAGWIEYCALYFSFFQLYFYRVLFYHIQNI